jgi:hypothetical protein
VIVTKNAVYLHVPKTAGMWVADVLKPITLSHTLHDIPTSRPQQKHVFAFVRSPWSWYASFYQFHVSGSDKYHLSFSPVGRAMVTDISFEEFVHNSIDPTVKYKQKILNYIKLDAWAHKVDAGWLHELFTTWLESNDGLYQHFCNIYCRYATKVGMFENLRSDLLDMVSEANDLTPIVLENIVSSPPLNVTATEFDYTTLYTHDLYDAVKLSSAKLIEMKNYEF